MPESFGKSHAHPQKKVKTASSSGSRVSYSLGNILVVLLADKPGFVEFVKSADWKDAGQDAAVSYLEQDLGEVLGGFLGPGNWRPQRKAIAGYLLGKPAEPDKK
jgi:hypothetical protein